MNNLASRKRPSLHLHRLRWIAAWLLVGAAVSAQEPAPESNESAAARIERALETKVDWDFREQPLQEVLAETGQHYGISVQTDAKALDNAGVSLDFPISFRLQGARLRTALRLLLAEFDAVHISTDGVLLVTTAEAAWDMVEARVYPVEDLVLPNPQTEVGRQAYAAAAPGSPEPDFDSLIELISSSVRPQSWSESSNDFATHEHSMSLTIVQTAEIHRDIEQLLADLRQAQRQMRPSGTTRFAADPSCAAVREPGRIERALASPCDLELKAGSLQEWADLVAERFEIPVLLDRMGLLDAGLSCDVAVASRPAGSLELALVRALAPMEMDYLISDDVLLLTNREHASDCLVIRVYAVEDLLLPDPSTAAGAAYTQRQLLDLIDPDMDSLQLLIQQATSPQTWSDVGGPGTAMCHAASMSLAVAQTHACHRQIERLLAGLRRARAALRPLPPLEAP